MPRTLITCSLIFQLSLIATCLSGQEVSKKETTQEEETKSPKHFCKTADIHHENKLIEILKLRNSEKTVVKDSISLNKEDVIIDQKRNCWKKYYEEGNKLKIKILKECECPPDTKCVKQANGSNKCKPNS